MNSYGGNNMNTSSNMENLNNNINNMHNVHNMNNSQGNMPNNKLIDFANNIDNLSINNSSQKCDSLKMNYQNQEKINNLDSMKSLSNEIVNNLKGKNSEFVKREIYENELNDDNDDDDDYNDYKSEHKNKKKNKNENNGYSFLSNFNVKNFVILFSLYFILSQDMIKDAFASYFMCLNPDNLGRIGMTGVVLYGLILTVLYFIISSLF